MGAPCRYSAVPWLADSDLRPMGDPETTITVGQTEHTDGLYIPRPFGEGTDAMLSIHAVRDGTKGGVVKVAITSVVEVETVRQPTSSVPDLRGLMSNPRRYPEPPPSNGDEA